jgi:DNA-binding transcriptional LysR family regulator
MVSEEQLDALDLLLWLGSGQQAAARMGCNQSSVSRRIQGCLETLSLRLRRIGGQHRLSGRQDFLALERHIHQLVRFERQRHLRLEATHCISHLLTDPPLPGWILGSFDHHGVMRMHTLLRERVVDAWISSDGFDLPAADDPDLVSLPLSRWPARLLVSRRHPLVGERGLSSADLDRFPVLEFPESIYPRMAHVLQELGFGASHLRLPRYDRGSWNEQTADQVTLSFGSTLSVLGVPDQVEIDWDLGLESGESVVLRRDLVGHGAVADLVHRLRRRFEALRPRCPDLSLLR